MIRKLMVPVFAAMALVMVMGTAALAADTPHSAHLRRPVRQFRGCERRRRL